MGVEGEGGVSRVQSVSRFSAASQRSGRSLTKDKHTGTHNIATFLI